MKADWPEAGSTEEVTSRSWTVWVTNVTFVLILRAKQQGSGVFPRGWEKEGARG